MPAQFESSLLENRRRGFLRRRRLRLMLGRGGCGGHCSWPTRACGGRRTDDGGEHEYYRWRTGTYVREARCPRALAEGLGPCPTIPASSISYSPNCIPSRPRVEHVHYRSRRAQRARPARLSRRPGVSVRRASPGAPTEQVTHPKLTPAAIQLHRSGCGRPQKTYMAMIHPNVHHKSTATRAIIRQ